MSDCETFDRQPHERGAHPAPARGRAAVAGVAAAAAALASGELAAVATSGPSLVVAVAGVIVDRAPRWFVELGIETFGRGDKRALVTGVVIVAALLGAAVGVVAARRPLAGVASIAVFGALGAAAAAGEPEASNAAVVVTPSVAVAVGGTALVVLVRLARRPPGLPVAADPSRRRFLTGAAAVALLAGLAVAGGRTFARASRAAAARARVILPRAARAIPPPPAAAAFTSIDGLSPLVTSNRSFYRIDTALVTPDVDLDDWRLRVRGRVDRPLELTYDELLARPLVERYTTLTCVSNVVGGNLIGTARWLGVPLGELLEEAGARADGEQVVGRSVDGFTAGFPLAAVSDGRTAMVAVGMNGEPLPLAHGFPARLVVAGLYGYVSATKWLTEVELAGLDDFDAYWVRRGWAKTAPVKIQSRIDVPRPHATIAAGDVVVAGVAWAPTDGVSAVEVQVDDEPWRAADLADVLDDETWRQWRWRWPAEPGRRRLRVRAFDGNGRAQDGEDRPPFPDGATGYHAVAVNVADR